MLHNYEWTPPSYTDSPTLFFNVTEVRLALQILNIIYIETEEYPYDEGLIGLTLSHELTLDHVNHIPEDRIQPSLVGNIYLPRKETGEPELYSIMLDGHHSALRCINEKRVVRYQLVPPIVMQAMAYKSFEDMVNSPVVVLEGAKR
jgi:hypothetical protein